MTVHILKVQPQFWDAIADGSNPSNIRLNDRKFHVGDLCELKRYDPSHGETGEKLDRVISHILTAEEFEPGLKPGYVILGFEWPKPDLRQCGWLQFHPQQEPQGDLETQSLLDGDIQSGWTQEPIYRLIGRG